MDTKITPVTNPTWGLTTEEYGDVSKGFSIKNDIMGKDVYNDSNENIGTVEDLLVTRDKAITYAIIGVGGFLGIGRHDVAIAVHQLRITGTQIVLPGATEETLKNLPAFEYDEYR
jgi:sporulation protein YlmC with PRC-barrel domain